MAVWVSSVDTYAFCSMHNRSSVVPAAPELRGVRFVVYDVKPPTMLRIGQCLQSLRN